MIGQTIGHYRIDAKLGEGGMGVVYRATDLKLNRPVAIKFLSNELADESQRRRFQQEAQAASALNHPHILTVFETGTSEGREYLVTEFIDGYTLREWVAREQASVRQIVELLAWIADALACAHQAGILHRDIKPENILVSKTGYAKLVDFGLAKILEPPVPNDAATRTISAGSTRPGVIMGTVAYMSPEQAAGKPVDSRSDIFSFGVVLYEMVTGKRPFQGKTDIDTLHAILNAPPRPLETRPDLSYELRLTVDKALEKEAADRYQSIRDVVVDLRRLARHKSVEMAPITATTGASATRPLRWLLIGALAGLAIAAIAAAIFSRSAATPWENPLASAQFTRFTDFEGSELEPAISPDGRFVAFLSDRDGPYDLFISQVGTGRFVNLTQGKESNLLAPAGSLGFSGDGSQIWLKGGMSATIAPARLIPIMGGAPRFFVRAVSLSWSPDGNSIAFPRGRPDGDTLFVADRNASNEKVIFNHKQAGMHAHFPTWSRDGQWIYFVSGNASVYEMDLWRVRPTGGEAERVTRHNNDVRYPAAIDNRTVLYVTKAEDGSGPYLYAVDVERHQSHRVSFGLEQYTSVNASADGHRVVASVSNPNASLFTVPILDNRVAEESDVKRFPVPNVRALAPRFGPDALFYLSSLGGGDGLWRFAKGETAEVWKGADGPLFEPPAVSPDGRQVAFNLRRRGRITLHVMNVEGGGLRPLAESIDVRDAGSWSPDGRWIAIGGNDSKGAGLFKVPTAGGSPLRLTDKPGFKPVWSPDGRLIVYSGPATGREQAVLGVSAEGVAVPLPALKVRFEGERYRFLPSGKGLIYMQGLERQQDFWLLDLTTRKSRPLTRLHNTAGMRTFDVSTDGKQIVFDRLKENSDIVLIDLKK